MNITKHITKDNAKKLYVGKFILKEGYSFVNADEYGYSFLGGNSIYSIVDLAHEDDREELLEALKESANEEQIIIIRLKAFNDVYRWLYMSISPAGVKIDGFDTINVYFTDIVAIRPQFENYMRVIEKYRTFLGLSGLILYEYQYDLNQLAVYKYVRTKSDVILRTDINTLRENVLANSEITPADKVNFEGFLNSIEKGVDAIHSKISGKAFGIETLEGYYDIIGNVIFRDDKKIMSVGVITPLDHVEKEKPYYLTDAGKDAGTGLLNKRAVSEYTHEKLRSGISSMYYAIIDVDDFKNVNDNFGHMIGDQVLLKVSEILRSATAQRGIVGRFGGDEFFILFEALKDETDLRRILKLIAKHTAWEYPANTDGPKVTLSIGVSKFPDNGTEYDDLFKCADKALYIAKAKGKNRFIIYNEEKHGAIDDENSVVNAKNIVISNEQKLAVINNIISDLLVNGTERLTDLLNEVCKYFNVDGISIYVGNTLERVLSVGPYVNMTKKYPIIDEYFSKFDMNNTLHIQNVKVLENTIPDIAKFLEKQNITAVSQIYFVDDGVRYLISFDVFNRIYKRSDEEKNMLAIIGNLISKVILEERKGK